MRRIAIAAMLAGLGLFSPTPASANDGPCTFGLGCCGNCLKLFPKIHQHGPLFNYGPYYGYPPFEPYGYWNSYLQYTGPVPLPAGGGPGAYGWIHGPNPHTFGHGFPHPLNLGGGAGILHGGGGGILHKQKGCSSCAAAAEKVVTGGNALDRFTGVGSPESSQAYYAETPSIITVGYTGR
jgi:hypothetical protein